jgi:hypothetical protein
LRATEKLPGARLPSSVRNRKTLARKGRNLGMAKSGAPRAKVFGLRATVLPWRATLLRLHTEVGRFAVRGFYPRARKFFACRRGFSGCALGFYPRARAFWPRAGVDLARVPSAGAQMQLMHLHRGLATSSAAIRAVRADPPHPLRAPPVHHASLRGWVRWPCRRAHGCLSSTSGQKQTFASLFQTDLNAN